MGSKGKRAMPEFVPYSQRAHESRRKRKTDSMTYDQLVQYVANKL